MHTEAHLFSLPNDCLQYDKLWGPSQRVVTLFYLKKCHLTGVTSVQATKYPMKVLGGKSHPALNNLKQFIKVS